MISLQQFSFAQLHPTTINSSDIQMSFKVGELYAKRWIEFIKSFDVRQYDLSNNGIVRKLIMNMNDSTIVIVEIQSDFVSSMKNISISFNNYFLSTSYNNFESFDNALNELFTYYGKNHKSV